MQNILKYFRRKRHFLILETVMRCNVHNSFIIIYLASAENSVIAEKDPIQKIVNDKIGGNNAIYTIDSVEHKFIKTITFIFSALCTESQSRMHKTFRLFFFSHHNFSVVWKIIGFQFVLSWACPPCSHAETIAHTATCPFCVKIVIKAIFWCSQ